MELKRYTGYTSQLGFIGGIWVMPISIEGVYEFCIRPAVVDCSHQAFGLYLNRDAGILSGGVGARPVPAWPVRAGISCVGCTC
jgi:hypothetical protein